MKKLTVYNEKYKITIAIMGCRVNGPGETDDADLGLWCGPTAVNLKKKDRKLGYFGYEEVLPKLRAELDRLIAGAHVSGCYRQLDRSAPRPKPLILASLYQKDP